MSEITEKTNYTEAEGGLDQASGSEPTAIRHTKFKCYTRTILNKGISAEAFGVYVVLKLQESYHWDTVFATPDTVMHAFTGARKADSLTQSIRAHIYNGISELNQAKIVKCIDYGKEFSVYDLTSEKENRDKDTFVLEDVSTVQTIMNLPGKNFSTKLQILRYWFVLMGTVNVKLHYGCMAIIGIAKRAGLSRATCISYNHALEEAKLLFVYRSQLYIEDADTKAIKRITNSYGRYTYRGNILVHGQSYDIQFGKDARKRRHDASTNHSLALKYNYWLKGKAYSDAQLRKIYVAMDELNERYRRAQETRRIKDLTGLRALLTERGILDDDGELKRELDDVTVAGDWDNLAQQDGDYPEPRGARLLS